jgi:hypothetical protein
VDQQQIFKADDSLYRPGGQRFGSRCYLTATDIFSFRWVTAPALETSKISRNRMVKSIA